MDKFGWNTLLLTPNIFRVLLSAPNAREKTERFCVPVLAYGSSIHHRGLRSRQCHHLLTAPDYYFLKQARGKRALKRAKKPRNSVELSPIETRSVQCDNHSSSSKTTITLSRARQPSTLEVCARISYNRSEAICSLAVRAIRRTHKHNTFYVDRIQLVRARVCVCVRESRRSGRAFASWGSVQCLYVSIGA